MSNTQIPITELEILRGIQRDIAEIDLHCLSSVQGFKGLCIASITQCNRAESEILTNPVQAAWAAIVDEPTFGDEIPTETSEEAEALDTLEAQQVDRARPEVFNMADFAARVCGMKKGA